MTTIKVGNLVLPNKVLVGPMAGVSDVSFRSMLAAFEPGLIYSEMISDKGIIHNNQRTHEMCRIEEHENLVALQLFGMDVDEMREAARFLENHTRCDIIDINMGCPVNKVVKTNGGSSLMKDPEQAYKIVRAIRSVTTKPITVKMRTGWDSNNINAVEMAKGLEEAGVSMIAIHGRTRQEMYSGDIDFETIRKVKEAVSIPVIGNGNIRSVAEAHEMIEKTGVDGIMLARSVLNNPWLIEEIKASFENKTYEMNLNAEQRFDWLRQHFLSMIHYLGETIAVKKMRGFSSWYIAGLEDARALKSLFIRMQSLEEFDKIVANYLVEKSEIHES